MSEEEGTTWFGDEQAPADEENTGNPAGEETPPEPEVEEGAPPSAVQMPEWVPAEFQDPDNRAELLKALGVETPGEPERPDWLPEKFETPEALADSYKSLEQKLGGKSEVPEQYELELPEGVDELPEADVEAFKDAGLSNESAQKLMNYMSENVIPQMREQNVEHQTQQLASSWSMTNEDGTPDSEALATRVAAVKQWADKNVPEGVVKELSTTATGVQSLYNLMKAKGKGTQSSGPAVAVDPDQLQQMVNDPRYWTDEAFQKQVNNAFERAYDS